MPVLSRIFVELTVWRVFAAQRVLVLAAGATLGSMLFVARKPEPAPLRRKQEEGNRDARRHQSIGLTALESSSHEYLRVIVFY